MKFKELQSKSKNELMKIKSDLSTEIIKEKALIKIGTQPKNCGQYRESKKTIAKINMLLHEQR